MSKIKVLYAAVTGLLLLNAGMLLWMYRHQPAAAGTGQPPQGQDAGAFIIQQLQLDAAQIEVFDSLREDHHRQAKSLRRQNRQLHDAYFALLKSDAPSTTSADSLVAAISTTQQAIDRLNFSHFKAIRALCRNEQLQLYDRTIDEISRRVSAPVPMGPPPPAQGPGNGRPPRPGEDGPPPPNGGHRP